MRSLILILVLLTISAAVCLAAPTYVPTTFIGDQVIKSGSGIIIDGNIYYAGVTAGDRLVIKNGTSTAGTPVYTFVAPAANGSAPLPYYKRDIVVDQGIYLDETKSGGLFGLELVYQ